jgi:hypothetical protein
MTRGTELLDDVIASARQLDSRLQRDFHAQRAEIAELRASGVTEARIQSLYDFNLTDYTAAVRALVTREEFTHPLQLAVGDLHASFWLQWMPPDSPVAHHVNAELEAFSFTGMDRFEFALLHLILGVHYIAQHRSDREPWLNQLTFPSPNFDPNFERISGWQSVQIKVYEAAEVMTRLEPLA